MKIALKVHDMILNKRQQNYLVGIAKADLLVVVWEMFIVVKDSPIKL